MSLSDLRDAQYETTAAWLDRLSTSWQTFQLDEMPDDEVHGLFCCVNSGYVQQRCRVKFWLRSMADHSILRTEQAEVRISGWWAPENLIDEAVRIYGGAVDGSEWTGQLDLAFPVDVRIRAEGKRFHQEWQRNNRQRRSELIWFLRNIARDRREGGVKPEIGLRFLDPGPAQPPASIAQSPGSTAVYISYAWGDHHSDAGRQRGEAVERLSEKLIEWGYEIVRDKNELHNGDLISKFVQRIGRGNHVLVILSEKYLLSANCMTELFYVYQRSIGDKEEFLRRVIPVVVDDARGITDWREQVKYAEHWQREFKAMESHLSVLGEDQQKRHRLIKQWHTVIGDILGFVSDKIHPHGFDNIVKDDFAAVRELLARNLREPNTS